MLPGCSRDAGHNAVHARVPQRLRMAVAVGATPRALCGWPYDDPGLSLNTGSRVAIQGGWFSA